VSQIEATKVVPEEGLDPKRWRALGVIALAQLMVILDSSIVNIAIPSAKISLHISNANQQWVVTSYTLAFGSLLLLGGRIADYVGRKKIFIIGLLGFAGASALGGIASTQALLFAARGLQGAFGAMLMPAALSLLNVTFRWRRSNRPHPWWNSHRIRQLALVLGSKRSDRNRGRSFGRSLH
jgi:MFS family permease